MSSPITLDDSLKQLLAQDIFVGMGLEDLPEGERAELMETMLATIKDRVLARVLDELSADERTELTRLTDAGRADEVSEFVAEHVENLEALMTQEAIQYKAEMVQNAAHIRALLGEPSNQPVAKSNQPTANSQQPIMATASKSNDNLPTVIPDDLPVPYVPPGLPATIKPTAMSNET